MSQSSIQRRLIAAVVISQLLLAAGLVSVAVYLDQRQLRNAFDSQLRERAMGLAALVRYSEDEHPRLIFEGDLAPPPLENGQPDFYEVQANGDRVLARSPNWQAGIPSAWNNHRRFAEFKREGKGYRGLRLQNVPVLDRESDAPSNDVVSVTYAAPTQTMEAAVWHTAIYAGLGSIGLLCITVSLALWGLRRGLRPLADLAASAAAVSTTNWELQPTEAARRTAELAPLIQAMSAMLDGLHRAFTQQRDFLANAAHELKTPVAILKSTLQALLQRRRTEEEYRAGLEEALTDMARLEKLLHSMLRLARAEQWAAGSLQRDLELVDVAGTCQAAVERWRPIAQQRGIELSLDGDDALPIRADSDDLELVWSNLLENAIRFSPEGASVQVRVRRNGTRGYVEVEDHGPGISDRELPHLFERFHRGDSSRARDTGGYGLGLAIAKALIEAYGGTISPTSRPGEGTRMTVSVPLQF